MSSSLQPVLAEHLAILSRRLVLDLDAARLFRGTSDIGSVAEESVAEFFRAVLPARYSLGVGEVVSHSGQTAARVVSSQQKDILVFAPEGCAPLGRPGTRARLYPAESIYAVIEVKASIRASKDLVQAADQTLEVKRLCAKVGGRPPPITVVFALESRVHDDTLFGTLQSRAKSQRPDFVIVLRPRQMGAVSPGSLYFTHWLYHELGRGLVQFKTADEAAASQAGAMPTIRLTSARSEQALLWLYLFLTERIDAMILPKPNLWLYANASGDDLGWKRNE